LRAIETRRSIARSANTGISCWVDQRGVIHDPTAWWEPTAIRASLRLNEERTFFVRHGDLVGRSAIILSILLLLWIMVRWVQHKRSMSVTSDVR
jgi:apolipoprotein N-acyltransferase